MPHLHMYIKSGELASLGKNPAVLVCLFVLCFVISFLCVSHKISANTPILTQLALLRVISVWIMALKGSLVSTHAVG